MTGEERQNVSVRSANIHVIGICNYRCQHCFDRCLTSQYMTPDEWKPVLDYLKAQGVEKINIAGGEPFLYPHLNDICTQLKTMGFKVSIVSNGSKISEQRIIELCQYVDWLGLSVDSPDEGDEISIGRHCSGCNHIENIKNVASMAHSHGIKVKLNITTVRKSVGKDFTGLIDAIKPERVKVFRALTLKGANDDIPDTWSVTIEGFESFKQRHSSVQNIVFEDNCDMIASYLMFDPVGRWMVNSNGVKRFLPFEKLVCEGFSSEIDVSRYLGRNAMYEW